MHPTILMIKDTYPLNDVCLFKSSRMVTELRTVMS